MEEKKVRTFGEGICEYCGKPYMRKSPQQRYCNGCQKEAHQRDAREREHMKAAQRKAEREAKKPKQEEFKPCRKMKTCIYGGSLHSSPHAGRYCNYIGITGRPRGCKPSECDKYKRRKKGARNESEDWNRGLYAN